MNTRNHSTWLPKLNCLCNPWVGQESNWLLQSVGTLAYYTIITLYSCFWWWYNTTGIIPQLYIRTNSHITQCLDCAQFTRCMASSPIWPLHDATAQNINWAHIHYKVELYKSILPSTNTSHYSATVTKYRPRKITKHLERLQGGEGGGVSCPGHTKLRVWLQLVKLAGVMFNIRCWSTTYHMIAARDADERCWNRPVWSTPQGHHIVAWLVSQSPDVG